MQETVALAGVLKDYGLAGGLAISLIVNAYLFKLVIACLEARVREGVQQSAALESSSRTNAAVTAALVDRDGSFERTIDSVAASDQRLAANQATIIARLEELFRVIENRRGARS